MTLAASLSSGGKKHGVGGNGDAMLGFLLVAPILITMAALVFAPMGRTVWDSLHRVNPMQAGTPFVGLENYARMFSDGQLGSIRFSMFCWRCWLRRFSVFSPLRSSTRFVSGGNGFSLPLFCRGRCPALLTPSSGSGYSSRGLVS